MIGQAPAASARSGAAFTVRHGLRVLPQLHERAVDVRRGCRTR